MLRYYDSTVVTHYSTFSIVDNSYGGKLRMRAVFACCAIAAMWACATSFAELTGEPLLLKGAAEKYEANLKNLSVLSVGCGFILP